MYLSAGVFLRFSGDAVASKESQETLHALLNEAISLKRLESRLDSDINYFQQQISDFHNTEYVKRYLWNLFL